MPPNRAPLDQEALLHLLPTTPHQQQRVESKKKIQCAILGCGMMGQEHISYIMGYAHKGLEIVYLCDPHPPSLDKALQVMKTFHANREDSAEVGEEKKEDVKPPCTSTQESENSDSTIPLDKNTTKPEDMEMVVPTLCHSEEELLHLVVTNNTNTNNPNHNNTPNCKSTPTCSIDLLVIASPNYLHAPSLQTWGVFSNLTILVEKPVCVNPTQHAQLSTWQHSNECRAKIWVAMEYRYIPAIAKLLSLLHNNDKEGIGTLKMVTIRENRYPFLHKINQWNRCGEKTGDTLVEKCCHFFDLMRLITREEVKVEGIKALAQRGLNYHFEENLEEEEKGGRLPIMDSAYVVMPFVPREQKKDTLAAAAGDLQEPPPSKDEKKKSASANADDLVCPKKKLPPTMGCLELCMYAEGSRHQEEIIVTGTKGRLEAYLPENKVYHFHRPTHTQWPNRAIPPPPSTIHSQIHHCSNLKSIHHIHSQENIPTHDGYHYSSTSVEWYRLLECRERWVETGRWRPEVSLEDGLKAVEVGLWATRMVREEEEK